MWGWATFKSFGDQNALTVGLLLDRRYALVTFVYFSMIINQLIKQTILQCAQNRKIELKHKTDKQISPVNGLEP